MPHSSLHSPASESTSTPIREYELSRAAVGALWRGQVVDAIKLVRTEQHVDLKEAKDIVEAYLHIQPALKRRIEQTQADTREGVLRWLCFLVVGGVGLAYLLM